MNTVRHPAAPTQADVAFNDTIRSVCGQAICAGLWPREHLLEGMRLTERMDAAGRRGDVFDAIAAGTELLALGMLVAPDSTHHIQPLERKAA